MKKDVSIYLYGDEEIKSYSGTLERREESLVLCYTETEAFDKVNTELTITDQCIVLHRSGSVQAELHFSVGTVWDTRYHTPFGMISMHLETDSVRVDMDADGGTIDLRYRLTIAREETVHRVMLSVK